MGGGGVRARTGSTHVGCQAQQEASWPRSEHRQQRARRVIGTHRTLWLWSRSGRRGRGSKRRRKGLQRRIRLDRQRPNTRTQEPCPPILENDIKLCGVARGITASCQSAFCNASHVNAHLANGQRRCAPAKASAKVRYGPVPATASSDATRHRAAASHTNARTPTRRIQASPSTPQAALMSCAITAASWMRAAAANTALPATALRICCAASPAAAALRSMPPSAVSTSARAPGAGTPRKSGCVSTSTAPRNENSFITHADRHMGTSNAAVGG